jgi:hypothetical protein
MIIDAAGFRQPASSTLVAQSGADSGRWAYTGVLPSARSVIPGRK